MLSFPAATIENQSKPVQSVSMDRAFPQHNMDENDFDKGMSMAALCLSNATTNNNQKTPRIPLDRVEASQIMTRSQS